jgi:hypothetical protein
MACRSQFVLGPLIENRKLLIADLETLRGVLKGCEKEFIQDAPRQ